MNDQQQISRCISYTYSYPHEMAYRTFNPPVSLTPYFERLVEGQAGLYFHIPFCAHKCDYCNLLSQQSCDGGRIPAYLHTMHHQTKQLSMAAQDLKFTSFAVGGGTPLVLNGKQLDELFCMAELFDVRPSEVFTSIETSPEYADKKISRQLWTRGVERLSIGIQSLNDVESEELKRRPVLATIIDTLQDIREADFPQSNLDLIYGIEGQTVDSFIHSLTTALTCRPDELFIYPPYVRPGTRIDVRSVDDMCYVIYRSAHELLVEQGFIQVSMRCFVKQRTVKLGFFYGDGTMLSCGSGKQNYLGDLHYTIPYAVRQEAMAGEIDCYIRAVDFSTVTNGYLLPAEEVQIKFIIKNLIHYQGLDTVEYERCFDKEPDRALFREFTDQGWVEEKDRVLLLTEEGMVYSDCIGRPSASPAVRRLMSKYIYP